MKVFKKDIESRQGMICKNQAVTEIKVHLYYDGQDPNATFKQPATIEIALYKDKGAIADKKGRFETKVFTIPDVSQLQSYPALVQELIGIMVTDTNSPVQGATVEDTNDQSYLGKVWDNIKGVFK